MKGKALRRATQSADAIRVNAPDLPLIITTTELITPTVAKEMLTRNRHNRPINWRKVEEYADVMRSGRWRLHDQGIMMDANGNILTGQKRLWAIIKSDANIYMRVSRGNPSDTATLIDRGVPQSARDLAARETGRQHSPTEASIARAIATLRGAPKPSTDDVAALLEEHSARMTLLLASVRGSKKTREMLMILATLIEVYRDDVLDRVSDIPIFEDRLRAALAPRTASECWGRGAAFSLALQHAKRIVTAI